MPCLPINILLYPPFPNESVCKLCALSCTLQIGKVLVLVNFSCTFAFFQCRSPSVTEPKLVYVDVVSKTVDFTVQTAQFAYEAPLAVVQVCEQISASGIKRIAGGNTYHLCHSLRMHLNATTSTSNGILLS